MDAVMGMVRIRAVTGAPLKLVVAVYSYDVSVTSRAGRIHSEREVPKERVEGDVVRMALVEVGTGAGSGAGAGAGTRPNHPVEVVGDRDGCTGMGAGAGRGTR